MKRVLSTISIVVPVFNEQKSIAKIIERVRKANTLGLKKEIIVVDDGSTDKTRVILKKIRVPGLKKIYFKNNLGKGAALRAGFTIATGELILVQDADFEYYPEDYPLLLAPFLSQDIKVVYGSRELNINTHSYRTYFLGGKLITILTRLLFGGRLTDVPTGFKVFDRKLLLSLPLKCTRFEFCPEVSALLLRSRIPILEVPIRYSPRTIEDGKKIRYRDGIEAIITLLRVRVGL